MRVGFDATPLLDPRTGVGTYTHHLFDAMVRIAPHDPNLVATAFSARGVSRLTPLVPPHVRISGRRAPARLLRASWSSIGWPPVEVLSGNVDLFHGTNFVAPPARRAASVVTVHDLAYLHFPETVDRASLAYQRLVPQALERGATVCAVSDTMARDIVQAYGLSPERVHTTRLGVDPSWFDVDVGAEGRGHDSVSGGALHTLPGEYVVAVGTLEPRKNLTTLLSAYRLASRRTIDLPPLVLVGARGWGTALDVTGIPSDRVVRTGHLPLETLQRMVARARLLVFPSLYEGFGLPPLEALACGVPVVATELDVTHEVLGPFATFAEPRSPEGLLEAIVSALDDPPGTVETRRAHASGYTWENCARATLAAYRSAANR